MRSATIVRGPSTDAGTFGDYTSDSGFKCKTGELPDRNNLPGKSRVDEGSYLCTSMFSPHLNRKVYHLNNVPDRTDVEIHNGNWCGNTDLSLKSNVLGCIIVGDKVAELDGQMAVWNSVSTLEALEADMQGEPFMLTIKNQGE